MRSPEAALDRLTEQLLGAHKGRHCQDGARPALAVARDSLCLTSHFCVRGWTDLARAAG
jgi:hypothetical protein